MDIERLPAGELIQAGLEDLASGRVTIASVLVSIGAERLRLAGLNVPRPEIDGPEMRLQSMA